MTHSVEGKNQIGSSKSAKGTVTFRAVDPSTGEELDPPFYEASEAETEEALRLAEKAFPVYKNIPIKKRVEFLHAVATELGRNSEELIRNFSLESGLPEDRARTELNRTCQQVRSYVDALASGYALQAVIDPADPERKPAPKPDLRKINVPLGPVVVFGASNFPFAYSTIGGDVASALAAGCPVIVKGHAMHPRTGELVAAIVASVAQKHGMPDGVFSNLHAKEFAVAEKLVKDPRVKGVGFTGSFGGGMALHKMAGERDEPIPVFAEMGSVNPVFVLPSAIAQNGDEIAEKLASSVALNAGQFCTSPGILFLRSGENSGRFIDALAEKLRASAPQVMLNRGIFASYRKEKHAQQEGAKVLIDGAEIDPNRITPSANLISAEQFLSEGIRQNEVFGSYILIVACADDGQLIGCAHQLKGQLTAGIFFAGEESDTAMRISEIVAGKVGRVIFNGVPTGVEVSPAMQHGGTYPATTDSRFTSVGDTGVMRWMRPVCYQNCPDELLPDALKSGNPLGILRFINGLWTVDNC
jgi:2,5-dioxopentanoate dehydrogenase